MKKRITKRAERAYDQRVLRDARGVMLNPLPDADYLLVAEKKLQYAMRRLARIEGSYLHIMTNGALLANDPKWVYFNDQARNLDRDIITIENW